eukprot:g7219.t1
MATRLPRLDLKSADVRNSGNADLRNSGNGLNSQTSSARAANIHPRNATDFVRDSGLRAQLTDFERDEVRSYPSVWAQLTLTGRGEGQGQGQEVAVKIIRREERLRQQGLVEAKILQYLNRMAGKQTHHLHEDQESSAPPPPPPIVRLFSHFHFRGHLCLVFELLSDFNLYEFAKKNRFQGVSLSLIRRFGTQLLHGLAFLRQCGIIHCDLKPENVVLVSREKSLVKIVDFGSSCFEEAEEKGGEGQSRYYRAPEVILNLKYDGKIDMWSVGCILAELYTGSVLFPGANELEQMGCILEVFGCEKNAGLQEMAEKSPRRKLFFQACFRRGNNGAAEKICAVRVGQDEVFWLAPAGNSIEVVGVGNGSSAADVTHEHDGLPAIHFEFNICTKRRLPP